MRGWITVSALFGLVFAAASCGSNDNSCLTTADCFKGEVCLDDVCQAPPVDSVNANANSTPNNDNDTPNGNANNTPNGAPNNANNVSNTSGICRDDPFTSMCPTDDNDDFGEYIRMESGRGCAGSFDDFEGGEVEVLDQTMCPLESVDKYSTNLLPCDNITFVVEVTVTPKQDCDPGDWDFNMRLQGNDCIEHNDKMRCEDLPDGSKRATGFLEPSISLASPYIDITSLADNMRFDYDIKLVVRE